MRHGRFDKPQYLWNLGRVAMELKTFARIGVLSVVCLAVVMPLLATNVQASPMTWSIETVDAAANVGQYSSIALDSNGYPHISYYDIYWKDLKYARAPDEYFYDFSYTAFEQQR
jgi:hypothetical protein